MRRLAVIVGALCALVLCGTAAAGDDFWVGTNGPPGADVIALAANGSEVFAGTQGGGVFRSTDSGDSWARASGRSSAPLPSTPTAISSQARPRAEASTAPWTTATRGRRSTTA